MTLRLLLGATAVAILPIATGAQDLPACENCADGDDRRVLGRRLPDLAAEGLHRALRRDHRHQASPGTRARTRRWPSCAPRTRPATSPGTSSTSRARTASGSATRAWPPRSTPTRCSTPGDDGSTPTDDFGDSLVNECYIPQIVFSTTFGYRTDVAEWGGKVPEDICAVFDLENFPGKRSLEKRPEEEPRVGADLRRRRQGRALRRALDPRGRRPGARQARHHQGPASSGGRPAPRRRSSSPTRRW